MSRENSDSRGPRHEQRVAVVDEPATAPAESEGVGGYDDDGDAEALPSLIFRPGWSW